MAAGIGLAAFLLRLYQIGTQELWLDEAWSFFCVINPNGWRPEVAGAYSPPLYYWLLYLWIQIADSSEEGLRLLSALSGTLCVLTVIWAGAEVFTPRVGLWSGAFAAVAPMHIYYSQEARAYALLTFLLVLTYVLLWRAMQRDTWASWMLVAAAALAALYSHYFAVLALLPTIVLPLVWPETQQARRRWVRYGATVGLCALLYAPWLWWSFMLSPRTQVVIDWMQDAWSRTPPSLAMPKTLEMLGLGGQTGLVPLKLKQFHTLEFPAALRALGVTLLLLLGLWAVGPWGDQRLAVPWLSRRKLWLLAMLLLPLVALSLISLVRPVYMVGRYDMVVFPAYALLIGLGLAKLHGVKRTGPLLVSTLAVILFVPIGTKLMLYYKAPSQHREQQTAVALHTSVRNGDVVVFTGLRGMAVLYYLSREGYRWREGYCENPSAGRRFACRMFPLETEQAPSIYDMRRVTASLEAVNDDLQVFMQGLQGPDNKLWVVFHEVEYSQSRFLELPEPDSFLVGQLAHRGLRALPLWNDEATGIFQFVSDEAAGQAPDIFHSR